MSHQRYRLLGLLSTALISITAVTATPPLLPRYPYKKANTGTAVYPTGTGYYPTCTSYPTYHPTGSVSSTHLTSTTPPTTPTTPPSRISSTVPPTGTPTTFKILIKTSPGYFPPGPADGYALLVPGGPSEDGAQVLAFTADASQASTFTLNADGTLQSGDLIANMPPGVVYHDVWFQTEATIASEGNFETVCSIDAGQLLCSTVTGSYGSQVNDVSFTCTAEAPYTVEYGPTGRPYNTGCYNLELFVVAV